MRRGRVTRYGAGWSRDASRRSASAHLLSWTADAADGVGELHAREEHTGDEDDRPHDESDVERPKWSRVVDVDSVTSSDRSDQVVDALLVLAPDAGAPIRGERSGHCGDLGHFSGGELHIVGIRSVPVVPDAGRRISGTTVDVQGGHIAATVAAVARIVPVRCPIGDAIGVGRGGAGLHDERHDDYRDTEKHEYRGDERPAHDTSLAPTPSSSDRPVNRTMSGRVEGHDMINWLIMLLPGNPAHRRNPPGSCERQARHLHDLLDTGD